MRELGLQRPAIDLACAEARQGLRREDDPLWDFELGHPPVEKLPQFALAQCRFDVDHRHRHFAEPLVRRAEHRRFCDRGAGVAFGLDLGRGDVLAAADDDFLLAVDDEQITVLVEVADVAGAEISVGGERRRGRFRIAPIALDVRRAPDCDLTRLAGWKRAVIGAEDREFDDRLLRPAGRCWLGDIIAPIIGAAGRVGLGQAIAERGLGVREIPPASVRHD